MTTIERRRFLQMAGATFGAAYAGPVWLRLGAAHAAESVDLAGRKLVVVYLGGGNDGLNTVIPFANGDYQRRRSTLSYKSHEVLHLSDSTQFGLHPSLPGLRSLYEQRKVAIVHGVGYPDQDMSHFTSMDVWFSASPTHDYATGWLGRYLDLTPDDSRVIRAVSVGYGFASVLLGEQKSGVAVPSYGGFVFSDGLDLDPATDAYRRHEAFLRSCTNSLVGDAANAFERSATRTVAAVRAVNQLGDTSAPPPATFADQMTFAIELLSSSLGVEIAFLTPSIGFDDHAAQQTNHPGNLQIVDEAITRFHADVAALADADDYLLVMFSEFGRRPEENASAGTDHGTTAPMFVVGNAVHGGLYGDHPPLDDGGLDENGNMVPTVDFRDVYGTILDDWLQGPSSADIMGYTPAASLGIL